MTVSVAHFRRDYSRHAEAFVCDVITRTGEQRPVVVYRRRWNHDAYRLPPGSVSTMIDFEDPLESVDELSVQLRGVDVIHAHFGYDLPLAALVARELDRPLIASFHGADASSYLRRLRLRSLYREILPTVDAVVLDYNGMARRLVQLGARPQRVHVIRLGADITFWGARRHRASRQGMRLLTTGRLQQKKGHHLLLHALGRAVRDGLDVHLVIVGDGHEQRLLEQLVIAYRLESRVEFAGDLDRSETRELMAQSDVYVQSSFTAPDGDEETTPIALIEAMAGGLPVLATRHAGIAEVACDGVTGVLVDEGSVQELIRGLHRMVELRSTWNDMGRAGRDRIRAEFNLEDTRERWQRLYGSLAGKRSLFR